MPPPPPPMKRRDVVVSQVRPDLNGRRDVSGARLPDDVKVVRVERRIFHPSRQRNSSSAVTAPGAFWGISVALDREKGVGWGMRGACAVKAQSVMPDPQHVNNQKQGTKRESGDMRIITERCKLSSTSMESLYSRQSSSSGVTSDCSSNRGSLRLEDEFFCTRQFCGRARVHTEFTPSPYDTESLTLKVGDVINIIHKRPMGIWTGMLNDQVGNFKFIYVDELTGGPEAYKEAQSHGAKQKCKSTVHEVLKHLSLEEYSCSLEQNGYQTVDDLMRLKEHHLTKLKVTDPVHRRRLLAAVESFQQLSSNCHMEEPNQEAKTPGENTKADLNNCARDSGCHMPSDITNGREEDTDLPFPCGTPEPAKTMIS
nr:SAM domain-containing protein SAMSN-1-like [Nerophis lumbriciformis]